MRDDTKVGLGLQRKRRRAARVQYDPTPALLQDAHAAHVHGAMVDNTEHTMVVSIAIIREIPDGFKMFIYGRSTLLILSDRSRGLCSSDCAAPVSD